MPREIPPHALRIEEAAPLGEVALVPAAGTGLPGPGPGALADAVLRDAAGESTAETLRRLRQAFPDAPLTARVAGLAFLMRR
jgi:hypothetical protein